MIDVCLDEMRALAAKKLKENPDDARAGQIKRIVDDMVFVPISFNGFSMFMAPGKDAGFEDLQSHLAARMIFRYFNLLSLLPR